MNAMMDMGLNVAAWVYPPLQAPVRVYQNAKLVKGILNVASGVLSGGISPLLDGMYSLATSGRSQCEAARQLCLWNAGSDYWKKTVCEQVYQRCLAALG